MRIQRCGGEVKSGNQRGAKGKLKVRVRFQGQGLRLVQDVHLVADGIEKGSEGLSETASMKGCVGRY